MMKTPRMLFRYNSTGLAKFKSWLWLLALFVAPYAAMSLVGRGYVVQATACCMFCAFRIFAVLRLWT